MSRSRAAEVVAAATTWLFVPGDRPERFAKAAAAGADIVIIDLEDAVASDAKEAARANAFDAVRTGIGPETGSVQHFMVRINVAPDQLRGADLAALAELGGDHAAGFLGLVVPKLEPSAALESALEALPETLAVVGVIETLRGALDADDLAASGRVDRLAFGAIDMAADLGLRDDLTDPDRPVSATESPTVELLKSRVVLASRAAGIAPPIESPSVALNDHAATAATTQRAKALGFGGRLCIHPRQVEVVAGVFAPSAAELAWARAVLDAASAAGAVALDGQMIDEPVKRRAEQLLALSTRPRGAA